MANNIGALVAVASTAAPTYTAGDQVLLSTDLAGNLRITGAISFSAPQHVIVDSGSITVSGGKSNNSVVPGATNLGVLPGIANAATQTWTEGDQVLESMDLSGRQRVRGTLTHNNAAPTADLIGVMNGLANAVSPTYTEGDLVLQSVDLSGNTRIIGTKTNNAAPPSTQVGVIPALANAANPTWTEGDQVLLSVDLSGHQRVSASGIFNTTAPVLTNGTQSQLQVDVAGNLLVDLEGRKATYSAVANSTTTPTFTAAAGDIAVLPGSASKTIRVTRIEVTLSTSGTAAIETVSLIKRSAADTGGTSSAMTIVPHDSTFGAASAAPLLYTVAPTPGAAVGFIRATQFNDQSLAAPGNATWIWTFGDGRGGASGVVLRGVAQELCVNLSGAVATQTAAVSFEWTEE